MAMERQTIASGFFAVLLLLVSSFAHAYTWDFDQHFITLDSSVSLQSSWRIQKQDQTNISFGNSGNRQQIGDPVVALRFLPPVAQDNLGTNGLPQPGELPPGKYAVTDSSVCEEAGLTVSGANACWLAFFPDGNGSYDENADDGNLNFGTGIFSQQFRSVHDLTVDLGEVGLFARQLLFYDYYIENEDLPHMEVSDEGKELIGSDFRLLDFYFYGNFFAGEKPVSVKVGRQVISWGESGFISGMSALQGPTDFNQLIMSGGDLKQASVPVGSVWGSVGVSDNSNLEAYLKFEWEPDRMPPAGSYFSPADIIGAGGNLLCVNGGMLSDSDENRICVSRVDDRLAADTGEWGFKYSVYVPDWNDTEFGFHYLKYHSPSAILGGNEGIPDISMPEQLQAHYFIMYPENLSLYGFTFNTVAPWGTSLAGEFTYREDVPLSVDVFEVLGSAVGNLLNVLFFDEANGGQIAALLGGGEGLDPQLLLLEIQTNILGELIGGPEQLGDWLALQETSDFRDDPNAGNNCQTDRPCFPAYQVPLMDPLSGDELPSYINRDIMKASLLGIHTFNADFMGGNQILLIGEVGAHYIIDHPDFDELRLLTPGTVGRGVEDAIPPVRGLACCDRDSWSDPFSWGYVVRAQVDYPGLFGAYTLTPSLLWKHDVSGVAPAGSGGFIEGVQLLRLGFNFDYQGIGYVSFDYTGFYGDKQVNKLHDRDFVTLSFGYSF